MSPKVTKKPSKADTKNLLETISNKVKNLIKSHLEAIMKNKGKVTFNNLLKVVKMFQITVINTLFLTLAPLIRQYLDLQQLTSDSNNLSLQ